MKADPKTEADVSAALREMNDAYARRDLKRFLAGFATDADTRLYGTGADEKRIGIEQIQSQVERDWAQTESAQMPLDAPTVSAAGNVAWATVEGMFKFRAGGAEAELPARASFVLEKRDGKWLIMHAHFSTPNAAQSEGESF